jgi:hypothetical protein
VSYRREAGPGVDRTGAGAPAAISPGPPRQLHPTLAWNDDAFVRLGPPIAARAPVDNRDSEPGATVTVPAGEPVLRVINQ